MLPYKFQIVLEPKETSQKRFFSSYNIDYIIKEEKLPINEVQFSFEFSFEWTEDSVVMTSEFEDQKYFYNKRYVSSKQNFTRICLF